MYLRCPSMESQCLSNSLVAAQIRLNPFTQFFTKFIQPALNLKCMELTVNTMFSFVNPYTEMMYFEPSSYVGFNSLITYLNLVAYLTERFFGDELSERKKKTWVACSILPFPRPLICDLCHHKVPT